ncbi:MAG: hypothetical protein IT452_01480, partial [Planctomycetia bacterium]|nr:hypothetical protein [Planctomycetia bacterium]
MKRLLLAVAAAIAAALPAAADRAAAEAAVRDGDAALQGRNFAGAVAAYSRAVEADPAWGQAWGKRGVAKYRSSMFTAALEDLSVARSLEPGVKDWMFWRAQAYLYLDRPVEMLEETEALHKAFPDDLDARCLWGRALVRIGDVDGGIAQQEKAWEASRGDPQLPIRTEGYQRRADWKAMQEAAEAPLRGGAPSTILHFHRVVALVERGDFAAADAAVKEIASKSQAVTAVMCRLYLQSTPDAAAFYDPSAAATEVETLRASSANAESNNAVARALFLLGREREAADFLESRGRRTNFETLFWLGASYWKLGRLADARAA